MAIKFFLFATQDQFLHKWLYKSESNPAEPRPSPGGKPILDAVLIDAVKLSNLNLFLLDLISESLLRKTPKKLEENAFALAYTLRLCN